jgi:hypothetical protein
MMVTLLQDSCVSLFHHMNAITSFEHKSTWDEFFELFMQGTVETSSWFNHVRPWWQHRNDGNILFIKYEDMQADRAGHVRKLAAFIGVTDLTDEQVESIVKQTTFDAMKSDSKTNMTQHQRKAGEAPFMRKGIVGLSALLLRMMSDGCAGDWRSYFSEEQSRRLDALYDEELRGTGLFFNYGKHQSNMLWLLHNFQVRVQRSSHTMSSTAARCSQHTSRRRASTKPSTSRPDIEHVTRQRMIFCS